MAFRLLSETCFAARRLAALAAALLLVLLATPAARADLASGSADIENTQAYEKELQSEIAALDSVIRSLESKQAVFAVTNGAVNYMPMSNFTNALAQKVARGDMSAADAAASATVAGTLSRAFLRTFRQQLADDQTARGKADDQLAYLYSQRDRLQSNSPHAAQPDVDQPPVVTGGDAQHPPPTFRAVLRAAIGSDGSCPPAYYATSVTRDKNGPGAKVCARCEPLPDNNFGWRQDRKWCVQCLPHWHYDGDQWCIQGGG